MVLGEKKIIIELTMIWYIIAFTNLNIYVQRKTGTLLGDANVNCNIVNDNIGEPYILIWRCQCELPYCQ